jgi:hypothetical protein
MLALMWLAVGMHFALAIVLVRKYFRTRDVGFVWLGVAVVVWPLVSRILDQGERALVDRVLSHDPPGFYPFTLVERGQITIGTLLTSLNYLQQTIGVGLLLIAVIYLCRSKGGDDLQAATR